MGLSDYIDNLDTKNEFQFFNFQDLSNMNKVFDYYKKYAEKILNFNNSEGNIYNKKVYKGLIKVVCLKMVRKLLKKFI